MAAPFSRSVVIVGGGVAGLSVAHFLARVPGFRVTLVEREPRHNVHSSGRSAEIQRVAIPDEVAGALALETMELFADPRAAGLPEGLNVVEKTGLFVLSQEPMVRWHERLIGSGVMAASCGEELQRRAPHFRAQDRCIHWFKDAGRVRSERLIAALSRTAMSNGARFLRSSGEAELEVSDGRITAVRTSPHGRIPADDVVIAAGAWSSDLGASVGTPAPLRRTTRHIVEFERLGGEASTNSNAPVVWDDTMGFYVRMAADRFAVSPCDIVDAQGDRGCPRYETVAATITAARSTLEECSTDPSTVGPVIRAWTGYRDLTPDDRPILGVDDRVKGLHWCAGLGGHGMTLGLASGRATALSVTGAAPETAVRCSVHRFD